MLYQKYASPKTVKEAVSILSAHSDNRIRPISGGTDLMVQLKGGHLEADVLLDLSGIKELRNIEIIDNIVHVGTGVTFSEVIKSPIVNQHAFLLSEACRQIGATQIQNMGTVGGNIATASPCGDSLPCLYVLDATLKLVSAKGTRTLPIQEFLKGVRKTSLRADEIITDISFAGLPNTAAGAFVKFGLRQKQAISVVNVAVVIFAERGKVTEARIAMGSVAPTVVRSTLAEEILVGESITNDLVDRAGEFAREDTKPISDIRGSAAYRKYITKPLVKEAIKLAWRRINSE